MAFISANGRELIKIVDNRIVPQKGLLKVSIATHTTYKSETYFHDTRASASPIHVSKLTGWYVSQREQVELGKQYSGVIRFCKKALDDQGDFAGIFMLALDHQHLMNFIRGESADARTLLEDYEEGKYAYIYDEEGWVIAHPKLWDIRGVDQQGLPVPAYTEQTPSWTVEAGMIPLNMYQMDWRLYDIDSGEPVSSILDRVQRGEAVLATIRSLGLGGASEGLVRTRVYAPIRYHPDPRATHPVWGGVVMGASQESFLAKAASFTAVIEDISESTQSRMICRPTPPIRAASVRLPPS